MSTTDEQALPPAHVLNELPNPMRLYGGLFMQSTLPNFEVMLSPGLREQVSQEDMETKLAFERHHEVADGATAMFKMKRLSDNHERTIVLRRDGFRLHLWLEGESHPPKSRLDAPVAVESYHGVVQRLSADERAAMAEHTAQKLDAVKRKRRRGIAIAVGCAVLGAVAVQVILRVLHVIQ